MEYTIVVAETADSPATLQYLAPYTGAALAEYFMYRKRHREKGEGRGMVPPGGSSILLQARGWLVGKVSLGRNWPIRITSGGLLSFADSGIADSW
ncbi:unnamed protein product [Linum trigynum]|uniref:ATPase F1/V1/A1 complex alpha/beta subunit nucleotide-binding domain-containing protein n=1 Tax=Linum trigynum TaxID=586398 RepID=A0AAV2E2B1_9ROSI